MHKVQYIPAGVSGLALLGNGNTCSCGQPVLLQLLPGQRELFPAQKKKKSCYLCDMRAAAKSLARRV